MQIPRGKHPLANIHMVMTIPSRTPKWVPHPCHMDLFAYRSNAPVSTPKSSHHRNRWFLVHVCHCHWLCLLPRCALPFRQPAFSCPSCDRQSHLSYASTVWSGPHAPLTPCQSLIGW